MPKSNPSTSPSTQQSHPKSSGDDNGARLSDVALRKKKNADAQAAFRARRANYIATLEETVNSLESVVLQLQDSCREARTEAQELRQENARLRHESREREKYYRLLWQSRKPGQATEELPPLPPSSCSSLLSDNISAGTSSSHGAQYTEDNGTYRADDSCPTPFTGSENSYTSPAAPLVEPDNGSNNGSRTAKYTPYAYSLPMHGSPRDSRWSMHLPGAITGATMTDSGGGHTPIYHQSPSLHAPELSFSYPTEDQKPSHHASLDRNSYTFPTIEERFAQRPSENGALSGSRPMSPSAAAASSTSGVLTSPFAFTFTDSVANNDRREFGFRRPSLPQGDFSLHGGTAAVDIAIPGLPSDAARYRLNSRRDGLGLLPELAPGNEDTAISSDREHADDSVTSRLRRRRGTVPSSRSPSPGLPSLSCTVAVIKAQAFGALRRPRARGKKSSEGAARVAMDVLEARGIGVGGPAPASKRQRTDCDSMES
ncbi:hypothetical protein BKA70DRAFT_332044 [Coprinopsis sp. MPI-PUGE-AT-0042]|nr:hypothetical protein BKA70DRAFT_332044 [Coprinopsis sp. MPI-PUGE-AT-0042]